MKRAPHVLMNYSRILPWLYVGTNACCLRHFNAALLRKGVTADISLEAERVDAPRGVRFFLWLPTRDHTAPSAAALDLGIQSLEWFRTHRQTVYVHCKNGHGRAPTLVAAYCIRKRGYTTPKAVAFVQQRRPEIHLERSQRRALQRLEHIR